MFRSIINDKIGNILIYLSSKIKPLYLTKALKLLYIIDETSVKETGVPTTWLEYKVWKFGPVPEELYNEFKNNLKECFNEKTISLDKYVDIRKLQNPVEEAFESIQLIPIREFKEEDFSEYEVELLERVVASFGHLSAKDLVSTLHREGTLWDKIVKSEDLEMQFNLQNNRTNYSINFIDLLNKDYLKQDAYKAAYDSLSFQEEFLSQN
jgi:uncharacterized phage-associated protein